MMWTGLGTWSGNKPGRNVQGFELRSLKKTPNALVQVNGVTQEGSNLRSYLNYYDQTTTNVSQCSRFVAWLAWKVSVEPACTVVSAARYHCRCVRAENVPENGNLLPSDHLEEWQPQTPANVESRRLQSALLIEVNVNDSIDFNKSRIGPKATGIQRSGEKKYIYALGRGWCQEGILS